MVVSCCLFVTLFGLDLSVVVNILLHSLLVCSVKVVVILVLLTTPIMLEILPVHNKEGLECAAQKCSGKCAGMNSSRHRISPILLVCPDRS